MMDTGQRVAGLFAQRFGRECTGVARAPGRVNLLGEHVDYNGGVVLPAAIDRATYVAFSAAEDDAYDVLAADYDEAALFSPLSLLNQHDLDGRPLPSWAKYPAGVAWALRAEGGSPKGMNAVFASDVPRGSGLSSSASVELGFATAWKTLGGWSGTAIQTALMCQRAENEYVGVNCGIMDQVASACGEEDRLLLLDCRSLQYETLVLPQGAVIIIADTGVRHALAGSEYNNRREACEEAVRVLEKDLPGITSLRDVSVSDFNRLAGNLREQVRRRAGHVVAEMDRMRRAAPLLRAGDLEAFGALMNDCHASLRDLYEVSCLELDIMVRIAQSVDGCYGSRLTGGGFGGCTVNLVERKSSGAFVKALSEGYESETGRHPEIYVCRPSAGAALLDAVQMGKH